LFALDRFVRKVKKMKEQLGAITGKIVASLIIVIIVSCALLSAICPIACADSTWSETYGGAESDTAAGETVQASDGGYAILGDTSSFGAGGSDFWLIKTDADGVMQWNMTYGGAGTETSGDMCLTTDGGYAMSGYTTSIGAGGQDFWLVKVDAAGVMLWNMTYGGTGNEYAYHVEQTLDGGYALLGQTSSFGAGSNDFWLVKTDASGNIEWNMTYGGTGSDIGIHVLQTGDGGYALVGSTSSFGAGSNDAWLIKTDAAGVMLWNKTYGGTGMEFGQCLEPTSDGGYAIACMTSSFGAGGLDFWMIKIDSSGNVQWNQTYGGTGSDGPTHFIQTEDEGYAIVGFTTVGSDQNASLIKTDAFGNMEWNQTYGGTGSEIAYALLETSDGYYLLTINTSSFGAGDDDIWLVKTIPEYSSLLVPVLALTATAFVIINKKRLLRTR
jgi:predicted secreted protein